MNRRADRGRMGKSQKSAKPYGRATPNWIPQSGIHFSPSLSQAKDHPSINVRKILDTTHETLSYYAFPQSHWRHLRTNNPLERIMKEIRRRTRVVGSFPDGESALMLVAARLRHVSGTRWGTRLYMNMQRLCECDEMEALTTA